MKECFYITKLVLENVRCFEKFDLSFDVDQEIIPWTVITGDNATGKTCLLKAIAIGLCDEASAAGLMRESDEGYMRLGMKSDGETLIQIGLTESDNLNLHEIQTTIKKITETSNNAVTGFHDQVRQETSQPKSLFPWGNIFVCAYGAARGTVGTGDIAGYSTINSVYNLFNYSEGLQNPELTIHRAAKLSKAHEKTILKVLYKILFDQTNDAPDYKIYMDQSGILVDGPWGKRMPLRDLADGYKSTLLWVTDFIGWAFSRDPQIKKTTDIKGIVIIDEIEQHLHPKWQRTIIQNLKQSFPKIQFIVTTHSPLVITSISKSLTESYSDNLIHLSLMEGNKVVKRDFEPLTGYSIDQILASEVFDYLIHDDPEIELFLKKASILAGKGIKRTTDEEKSYSQIKKVMSKVLQSSGTTSLERELEEDRHRAMIRELNALMSEINGSKDDKN